jgi:hypothetical protein
MNSGDDDTGCARLFLTGLLLVTLVSALPHLVAEDRRAGSSLAQTEDEKITKTNEKSSAPQTDRQRFLPPGPSAEEIHDFLYPRTHEDTVEVRLN